MIGSFKQLNSKRNARGFEPPDFSKYPFLQSLTLRILASFLSGIMLALSFPGFGKSSVAFAAFVPLLYAVQSVSVKRAAWLGLLAGFVFFGLSLSWLGNLPAMVEGAGLKISAVLGYLVLALYCALYFIPFSVAASIGSRYWIGGNLRKNLRFMFVLTAVWVGSEYLRSTLFTGFPWNPLGVSQYMQTAMIQVAQWGGVYIISAYIIWMNVAVFITFRQYTHGSRLHKYRPHYELMVGLLPLVLCLASGIHELFNKFPVKESVNLALVQPNIRQELKWDSVKDQEIRDKLEELTVTASRLPSLDLIVWPETAVPDFVRASARSYDLVARMASLGTPLLVGSMDFSETSDGIRYCNSSILFDTNGNEIGQYDKQHLVPFGEYVPLPGLMRKFTPINIDIGAGSGSTLLPLNGESSFSVLICFEDTVAPLAINAVRAGARWLVNQTNDAWFDPSAQSEQHLAHAVLRCVENRVPMARCCNTGMTGFINAYGEVDSKVDVRTDGFMAGELYPRPVGMPFTFYTVYGDLFARLMLACAVVGLGVMRVTVRSGRRQAEEPPVM